MPCVFVIGGVCSSIGKGLFSASLAKLFEGRELRTHILKLDPYFNVDPGTMSPAEHGEVYVTKDGRETDLDLGHYERFTNCPVFNSTAGQIYECVLKRERQGVYLGRTIQLFPHIIDEIIARIQEAWLGSEVLIVEIGGTAGDKELEIFLQAIQQFVKRERSVIVHLSHMLFLKCTKEWKTKPVQHSVEALRRAGLDPDIVICRTQQACGPGPLDKIARMCNLTRDCVFEQEDLRTSIYELPGVLAKQHLDVKVLDLLGIPSCPVPAMTDWNRVVQRLSESKLVVSVGIVGKYTENPDAYKSVIESLVHACTMFNAKLELTLISAENLPSVHDCDAIVVPGGFGPRGWSGILETVKICRQNQTPMLGICLGMQAMCVEYARNVCGHADADSEEMNPHTSFPVVGILPNQTTQMGGTMRLGSYTCELKPMTRIAQLYGYNSIQETHRHRYEILKSDLPGLVISGTNLALGTIETVEIEDHPFMIGVQFHPEFRSKLDKPHPLFAGLIAAILL